MSELENLSQQIAEKLLKIKESQQERVVLENKLQSLNDEISLVKEQINKCDNLISTCKFQISERLTKVTSDFSVKLKVAE
jgi:septal ring factor EnvC (AmiA/AmiB activator)